MTRKNKTSKILLSGLIALVLLGAHSGTAFARILFVDDVFENDSEAFQIGADDDAQNTNITLYFGGTNSETIAWDQSNFSVSDDWDMNKHQLIEAALENVGGAAPADPVLGQIYYDTDDDTAYIWTGSWESMNSGAGGAQDLQSVYDQDGAGAHEIIVSAGDDEAVEIRAQANGDDLLELQNSAAGVLMEFADLGGTTIDIDSLVVDWDATGAFNLDSTGNLTLAANAEGMNASLIAGDNAPNAGEDGNDIALEAEDDILMSATGNVAITSSTWGITGAGSLNGITSADATTEDTVEALIFDADAQDVSGVWEIQDNVNLNFGNDADWHFAYDAAVDGRLEITGTGNVYYDLLNTGGDSTYTITNSDAGNVANLVVEGSITATGGQTKYLIFELAGGALDSSKLGTVAGGNAPSVRLDKGNASWVKYSLPVPDDWVAGTDMTVTWKWSPEDNGTGDVDFDMVYASIDDGETLQAGSYTDAIGGAVFETVNLNTELDVYSTSATIPAAALAAGDMLHFSVGRTPGDAGDTYNAHLNLHMVMIEYTGKKLL